MSETLSELMDKDPLQLTQENLDTIIRTLRDQRARFAQGDKTAGRKAKPEAAPKEIKPIDLADLGL